MAPPSFIESSFRSKTAYEASLLLPDAERAAAEAAEALRFAAPAGNAAAAAASSSSEVKAQAAAHLEPAGHADGPPPPTAPRKPPARPTAIIIIGMAGSSKSTLMQRLNAHLHAEQTPYYMVNLDPAVLETPFGANIDIRDTVNYREVMKQYNLGPNGGILTALNLFATRFEQVPHHLGWNHRAPPQWYLNAALIG